MRVGLLGGTFDPIHQAHVRVAQAAAEECRLSRVLLTPAAQPPHRSRGPFASYEDRLAMARIACAADPRLIVSELDGKPEKNYSILTVERLRATLPSEDEVYFLIGADAFADYHTWYRWHDLARLVTFAVVDRPGAAYACPEGVRVQRVSGVDLPVSSSEIRARLAAGLTPADLDPAVMAYIRERGLYSSV